MRTFSTLFTGAGGADCGLQSAGLEHLWGVELRDEYAAIARSNGFNVLTQNILSTNWVDLPSPDWLHCSPPCQMASVANFNQGETSLDVDLARGVVSAIASLKPKFFSLENVRGYAKFEAFKIVVSALRASGYAVEWRLLDSADYGVPQNRKRLWLLASLGDSPAIPWPTHADEDALQPSLFSSALPHVGWGSVADIAPMSVDGWSDRLQAALPNEPIPGCLVTGFKDASGNFSRPLTIRRKSQPAPTLLANMNRPSLLPWVIVATRKGLQSANRLTVPHMAALQGFPIDYQWGESETRALESIGNAVSTPVMCAIARANIPKHALC